MLFREFTLEVNDLKECRWIQINGCSFHDKNYEWLSEIIFLLLLVEHKEEVETM